jgi:hypothetical protein
MPDFRYNEAAEIFDEHLLEELSLHTEQKTAAPTHHASEGAVHRLAAKPTPLDEVKAVIERSKAKRDPAAAALLNPVLTPEPKKTAAEVLDAFLGAVKEI